MFPFDFIKIYFSQIATKIFPNVHQNVLSLCLKQRMLEQTYLLTLNYIGLRCLSHFIPYSVLVTGLVTSPLFSNIPTISHFGGSPPSIWSALLSFCVSESLSSFSFSSVLPLWDNSSLTTTTKETRLNHSFQSTFYMLILNYIFICLLSVFLVCLGPQQVQESWDLVFRTHC